MAGCFWKFASPLLLTFCLGLAAPLSGQTREELPPPYPATKAPTQRDIERRESLKRYVLGLLCERDDRLIEALKAYEEAARLDPQAPAVFKAQVPLLLALDRGRDALTAITTVLELDPADHETWFIRARLHKTLGQFKEARQALQRGLATPGIKERPDVAQQIYLDLGGMHETDDECSQAIDSFTEAVKILEHPDLLMDHGDFPREVILARAAETHERIGHLHRKLKKYDDAIAAYQKAQAINPDRAGRLNFNLAQLCFEQKRLDQALGYLNTYLRLQPLGLEAYEMKIDLLTKLSRTADVVPWLEHASRADQHNLGLKVLLARHYVDARQFEPAEKLYKAMAEDAPAVDVYRGLFRLQRDDPRAGPVQSIHLLDKALEQAAQTKGPPGLAVHQAKAMIGALREDGELARDVVRAASRLVDQPHALKFDTLHLLAVLADKHKQAGDAEKFYRHGLTKTSAATEALAYGGLLRVLWKARKYEEALQVCRAGLGKVQGSNRILFHNEQAKALARLGRAKEALEAADAAVSLASETDKLGVRNLRVRVLLMGEKFAEAEAECLELLKTFNRPGEVLEVRYMLSNVYSGWRKLDKCEEQLEMILQADPNNATVNNDLGYIWADQNKHLEKSEAMIRKAIDLDRRQRQLSRGAGDDDKDNAAYIDSLGWVLFRRGKIDEARQQLELAVALPDGDDPTLWDHLGDVYFRLQMFERARTAWEKSINLYEQENRRKMDQRYEEVRRKLKQVETSQK